MRTTLFQIFARLGWAASAIAAVAQSTASLYQGRPFQRNRRPRRFATVATSILMLAASLVASAQTRPRAHAADGQVWVVWDVDTNNLPETYGIYAAASAFTNTSQATLVGRLFPGECTASILKHEAEQAYGARLLNGFVIPLPGDGTCQLQGPEGLFADTVRSSGSAWYAVVPFGQTNVTAADLTTNAVSFTLSLNDPPRPHLQMRTNSTSGHVVSIFAVWVDGGQSDGAARPDFPLMANAAKRGVAHTFMAVEPASGLPPGGSWPATVCLHGGNGGAIEWLPSNEGPRSINIFPTDGLLLAINDDLYRNPGGGSITTGHFGYAREYNPFTPALLPPGSTVVNYTQRRNIWILDWLAANANVDAHRISLLGHSNGAQGSMMLARVFPDRFSCVQLFNCSMRFFDDPAFVSIWGTAADNFHTSITNASGQVVRMLEVTRFTEHISPVRDLPFIRNYAGKCDDNNQRQWDEVMLAQMRWSDEHGTGLHFYWDLRGHGFDTWTDFWVDATTNATLLRQTQRDDVRHQSRYRNDQSYPAFHHLQRYANHGDPGPGYVGGNSLGSRCGLARDAQGNLVFNGDDHGTWGGYFDWDTETLTDTPTRWACTLFLVSSNTGYADVDACPIPLLRADVALRRPQQFTPAPGAAVHWQLQDAATGNVLLDGANVVGPAGLVTVTNVAIPRDPLRVRLVLNFPAEPPLTFATDSPGLAQVSWEGDSGYSSQLEHSPNLVDWFQLDLPAQELNGLMSVEIPPYLLDDTQHFFRLARAPLVTTPVPTEPGFYTGLTFVHGGIARNYYLGVPAGWNASTNWPLMLALPGHGQSIAEFAGGQAELRQRASAGGMILVFAEATTGVDSYRWFPYENPNTGQPYIDDAAFLLALVNELVASGLNVNTNRIYLSGFSNGGSMTHFMASRTNHPFAAFAIMESGTAPTTSYREPYNRLAPDSAPGAAVPAIVPLPWQPRPVMLMNMATSVPWPFEGRQVNTNIFFRGARHNVARWTQVNGHGTITNELGLIEPSTNALKTNIVWTATGNDRARVAYEDVRPDWNWPTNLIQNGWTTNDALRFPYVGLSGTNYFDQRSAEWVRTTYPHTIEPDPGSPTTHVRVNSGTMTVEIWRSAPLNRTNEVIFIGLSDGGHQWPNAADRLPFNGSDEVLKFFEAH